MLTTIRVEAHKLWRKPRTYLGFAAISGLVTLCLIAVKYENPLRHVERYLAQDFIMSGSFVNAVFLVHNLIEILAFTFLPLFACLVLGDLIASEAADGTLRTILCRPVSKAALVASKYIIGAAYAVSLTIFSGVLGYLLGRAFLGRGSLLIFSDGIWIFNEQSALLRLLAAYALVSASALAVGSMSFAISTFLSNSNAAIVGGMGLLYTSVALGAIDYFKFLRPYLIPTYSQAWHRLFVDPIDTLFLLKSFGVLLAYAAVSFGIGLIIFVRKDVLT